MFIPKARGSVFIHSYRTSPREKVILVKILITEIVDFSLFLSFLNNNINSRSRLVLSNVNSWKFT